MSSESVNVEQAVSLIDLLKTAIERFAVEPEKAVTFYRSVMEGKEGNAVIEALDHFVPTQGFEDVAKFTKRLDLLIERMKKDDAANEKAEEEAAAKVAQHQAIISAKGQLVKLLKDAPGTDTKKTLVCFPVDTFCNVTRYINNRDVVKRAMRYHRAEKKEDLLDCQRDDDVSIVLLDRERNKEIWDKTEQDANASGMPHTLPYIVGDANTRHYGWSTMRGGKPLMSHPVSGFVTLSVYIGWTNEEVEKFVARKCAGDNKETNVEKQERILKSADLWEMCTSDFIKKDSWKTAFRTIDRKYAKDTNGMKQAIEDFGAELAAIDCLKLETKNIATHQKLAGVRAAMITTLSLAHEGTGKKVAQTKWKEYWSRFFNDRTTRPDVISHRADIKDPSTGGTTRPADKTKAICELEFKRVCGLLEVEKAANEEASEQAAS